MAKNNSIEEKKIIGKNKIINSLIKDIKKIIWEG